MNRDNKEEQDGNKNPKTQVKLGEFTYGGAVSKQRD